jgi:PKD repeat protein
MTGAVWTALAAVVVTLLTVTVCLAAASPAPPPSSDLRAFQGIVVTLSENRSSVDLGQTVGFTTSETGGVGTVNYSYSGLPAGCASADSSTLSCTPTGTGAATVSVTVTDSLGNSGSASVSLTVNPALSSPTLAVQPNPDAVDHPAKFQASVSGGTPPYTYAYNGLPPGCASSNDSNPQCKPSTGGTYSVTVTISDSAGTSVTSAAVSFVVQGPLSVSLTATPTRLDLGRSITFTATASGGTGGGYTFSYLGLPTGCLSSNVTTLACTPTTAGSYSTSVQVTDPAYDMASSPPVAITVNPAPTVTANASPRFGPAPLAVKLWAIGSGGTGPVTFQWVLGDGNTSSTPSVQHTYANPGLYTATVWLNDSNGLSAHSSVTIAVGGVIAVTAAVSRPIVDVGEEVTLVANASGGVPPLTIAWSNLPPGCASADTTTLLCTPSAPGNFTVKVTATDHAGRTASSTIGLTVNPALAATASFTPVHVASCSSSPKIHFVATVSGGTPPYHYVWSFGDTDSLTGPASATHTYASVGTYNAQLTVNDSANQTATHPFSVATGQPLCGAPGTPGASLSLPSGYWIPIALAGVGVVLIAVIWWRSRHLAPTS